MFFKTIDLNVKINFSYELISVNRFYVNQKEAVKTGNHPHNILLLQRD